MLAIVWMFVPGCGYHDDKPRNLGAEVLAIAYRYPNGGTYRWEGTGCPITVEHKGVVLAEKCEGWTYCNGYTFAVVMEAAQKRGLLDEIPIDAMWRFKREWYASTEGSAERGTQLAIEKLGIGKAVQPSQARAGDFIYFQRPRSRTAHSAIFLGWERNEQGKIIGVHYRSSQPGTDGIGDVTEWFTTSGLAAGEIPPDRFYVARLSPG
ncbi:MAG: hypothetical protein Kow00105_17570 [Phycisphaeraceae bacterium]